MRLWPPSDLRHQVDQVWKRYPVHNLYGEVRIHTQSPLVLLLGQDPMQTIISYPTEMVRHFHFLAGKLLSSAQLQMANRIMLDLLHQASPRRGTLGIFPSHQILH